MNLCMKELDSFICRCLWCIRRRICCWRRRYEQGFESSRHGGEKQKMIYDLWEWNLLYPAGMMSYIQLDDVIVASSYIFEEVLPFYTILLLE